MRTGETAMTDEVLSSVARRELLALGTAAIGVVATTFDGPAALADDERAKTDAVDQ
jgi:hypothetical protein